MRRWVARLASSVAVAVLGTGPGGAAWSHAPRRVAGEAPRQLATLDALYGPWMSQIAAGTVQKASLRHLRP
jgi:hypothetical protein